MLFTQQRILIVGGSSGMGLAAARRLSCEGADVFIAGRSAERLAVAADSIEDRVETVELDYTDPSSLLRASERLSKLDHLVLAASSDVAWGPFQQVSPESLRKALNGKLVGYWQSLQAFIPILHRTGSIVMLAGAAARTAIAGTAALAAVNGAIVQLGQTLAKELAPLRVNVISPGLIDTPAYERLPEDQKRALFDATAESLPVGHTGKPEDVASAIAFLLANDFTTGAVIDVDGGARMAGGART